MYAFCEFCTMIAIRAYQGAGAPQIAELCIQALIEGLKW
jgi:hypothetical protein